MSVNEKPKGHMSSLEGLVSNMPHLKGILITEGELSKFISELNETSPGLVLPDGTIDMYKIALRAGRLTDKAVSAVKELEGAPEIKVSDDWLRKAAGHLPGPGNERKFFNDWTGQGKKTKLPALDLEAIKAVMNEDGVYAVELDEDGNETYHTPEGNIALRAVASESLTGAIVLDDAGRIVRDFPLTKWVEENCRAIGFVAGSMADTPLQWVERIRKDTDFSFSIGKAVADLCPIVDEQEIEIDIEPLNTDIVDFTPPTTTDSDESKPGE